MADVWFRIHPPEAARNNRFTGRPGVRDCPARDAAPVNYFMTLFTMNLMREITRQTNRYARIFIRGANLMRNSRVHQWIRYGGLKVKELKGFIAAVINMGLIRKPSIEDYWSTDNTQQTSWFRKMFSRNRFQLILKFLHVVDNSRVPGRNNPSYRPDGKIKPLLDFVNRKFKQHYTPRQEITIDETLMGTRGRTSMLQYIPSKASKFGVKFWVLAESATGYIMHMDCYLGKRFQPTPAGQSQGTNVVLKLLSLCGLENKYYHVVCDNFFTCINLAKKLLEKRTFVTGTLRANRLLPQSIKYPTVQAGESHYLRQGRVLLLAHKNPVGAKKPVRILSTISNADMIQNVPKVIKLYNKNMGGVDGSDMMLSFYESKRKTLKVWKRIMLHIIHRVLLNAFILYKENTTDRPVKTLLKFSREVVRELSIEHL